MEGIERTLPGLGLDAAHVRLVYLVGSHAWGTATRSSDRDIVVVVSDAAGLREKKTTSLRAAKVDAAIVSDTEFFRRVADHRWTELICLWLPPDLMWSPGTAAGGPAGGPAGAVGGAAAMAAQQRAASAFRLDHGVLLSAVEREVVSDWARVEKSVKLHGDVEQGKKTLCHALRMCVLARQIAESGRIVDYTSGNTYREELFGEFSHDWAHWEGRWKPTLDQRLGELREACERGGSGRAGAGARAGNAGAGRAGGRAAAAGRGRLHHGGLADGAKGGGKQQHDVEDEEEEEEEEEEEAGGAEGKAAPAAGTKK